jgi:branched-chain amino acid transport system ATP-binding protein
MSSAGVEGEPPAEEDLGAEDRRPRAQGVDGHAADSQGLEVRGLEVHRMGSPVVRDLDLVAPLGQVTVLLGTNGAGKTTLLEAISGIIPSAKGAISVAGHDVTGQARPRRARLGLAHVEQGRAIFPDLTAEENLRVAKPKSDIDDIFELFPELVSRRDARASLLSGGEQQMLVIARALVTDPKVLMLDEMSLGLAPIVLKRLVPLVRDLADRGVGVLLVEQYAHLALAHGDRVYVLSRGEIAFEGDCAELIGDPHRLRDLYLGAPDVEVVLQVGAEIEEAAAEVAADAAVDASEVGPDVENASTLD